MHEKNKYRHIPWNRYNLEKYRDTDFWSYRPALVFTVNFGQFKSSLLNKSNNFFKKKSYWFQMVVYTWRYI